MSKVTILTKPNRIVIASKGVQGAPGKDGVITPELEGLRDEAQQAAQDAAGSATIASDAAGAAVAAQGAAEGSAGQASASAALAEQARLLGATIGFATKADMDASLAHPDGTLALVTSDATAANNGTYRKTGASGSGAWVQSADRVTGLEGRVGAVELQAGATGMFYPHPSAINLDLNAGLLKITASQVRVFYGRSSFLLAGQEVAIPSARRRIIANVSTGEVSFTSATTTPSTHVVLGSYDHQELKLVGFPPHFVNGVLDRAPTLGRLTSNTAGAVAFDLDSRQMTLTAARLITPTQSVSLYATVPFPSNSTTPYRLEWTEGAANPVSFVISSAIPDPRNVIFGFARIQASSVDVYGIDQYTVTGGPPPAEEPLAIYEGTLIGTLSPEYINFDWAGGFLRITGDGQVRCLYGRNVPTVPSQDVPIPKSPTVWHKVLYDTDTGLISFLPANNAFQPEKSIVIGMVKENERKVYGFPAYYENGQPSSAGGSNIDTVEWLAVDGPTEPRFSVPALLPDFKVFGGSDTNTDHNTVYALYDALVSAYPDYVTRSTLGLDDAGNTIYRYDFKPPADNGSGTAGRLAKMILISSTHGYERAGIYCLYSALHQVCSRWQDDELLDTLRWNCHFIVVPCLVPYGFDNVGRLNPNGVDIARNFTAEWSASQANSGTGPLSEKESQYMDALMADNRDAIYCGSFHNFLDSSSGDTSFIWNASATRFGIRLAQRLVSRMSRKWKSAYPWLPQDNTTLFGYSNLSAPPGSEGKQSTLAYGIQGGSFEISRRLWDAPDDSSYSQYVNTLGTETIVNWLLMNLEHGTQLYNGRGS